MQILVQSKGVQKGPYSLEEAKQLLEAEELNPADLAWTEGLPEWRALSSFPELQPAAYQQGRPAATPPPFPVKKTEPLAVWSMILGIVSLIGCGFGGFLAAIPGVVCGHIGMSRIKRNPFLKGNGMAVAGLVTGYVSIASLPLVAALVLPAISAALERGQATQILNNCRQIHLAVQTAQLDGITTGNPKLGFPADAKITSKAALKEMLVANHYLTADDLDRLGFQNIIVANVSEEDPGDTVFLKAFSPKKRLTIIMRKGGDGAIYREGQDTQSTDPPRTPTFLD